MFYRIIQFEVIIMEIVTINAMWCPGCIVMHKVWDEIKKEYKDIKFN